ncbi:MAG TPA: amidohydrolase family protein [Rhodothermales bacterium]|nr:amidohydrolase family protein [Rhodothermales bacterium]
MFRRFAPLLLTALVALPARAQQPDPEIPRPSRTFAITNARVVVAPGRVLERATVVVRDGLIQNVGASVRVPFDAQVIRGDSLTVYAGFIDALGQVGIPRPQQQGQGGPGQGGGQAQQQQRVPDPGNPPRDRAGLQPDREASSMLKADDASVDAHRKQGFTLVHTVPYGGFLPGQGALVLLGSVRANDPLGAGNLVYRDDVSQFTQFVGGRGVYPGTPMAIMAMWRNLYRETTRRGTQREAYERGPSGRERPVNDPVYDALQPVVAGRQPVFFYAQNALEAHRALMLKRDLGFRLVLAGVPDAAEMTDRLKTARVPLLITLGLPDEPRADSSAARGGRRDSLAPVGGFDPGFRVGNYANIAGEKSNLEARVRATATTYTETAARLNREGVRFAFTTMGARIPDVQKNVRRMIGAGLPEDVALAALTTNAADVLGVSDAFGTVEAGKVANLVVTKGSYFAQDGQVRYVFVDGDRFTYEPTAANNAQNRGGNRRGPAGQTGAAPSVPGMGGRWSFTATLPGNQGTVGGTLNLTGDSGTIRSEAIGGADTPLQNVQLSGNTLTFSFTAGQYGTVLATLTVEGDAFSGTYEIPGIGRVPVTGTKQPG